MPLFIVILPSKKGNHITHYFNQIVETTMRFFLAHFTASGAHNKMIENENFVCFPC